VAGVRAHGLVSSGLAPVWVRLGVCRTLHPDDERSGAGWTSIEEREWATARSTCPRRPVHGTSRPPRPVTGPGCSPGSGGGAGGARRGSQAVEARVVPNGHLPI
jgi:hypothetical protein